MRPELQQIGVGCIRELLGEFASHREAASEAHIFSQNSGLTSSVVSNESGHFVIVRSPGPVATPAWQSLFHRAWGCFDEGSKEEEEYERWLDSSRNLLLGGPDKVPHVSGGHQSRIFKENLKHPHHFVERAEQVRYIMLDETFVVGGKQCRKLLDLSQAVAFALTNLTGATPRVAFCSVLAALKSLGIKFDETSLKTGPLVGERCGTLITIEEADLYDTHILLSEEYSDIEYFETYRGAFYELRRRRWCGLVYNSGLDWCVVSYPSEPDLI